MTDYKLKDCPFCGNMASQPYEQSGCCFEVFCVGCGATTEAYDADTAVHNWNKRVGEDK